MQLEEEILHADMVHEFSLVSEELTIILDLSAVTFVFPIMILCRYVGARMTKRRFFFTIADFFDILVFCMVAWVWEVYEVYLHSDIKEELFGPEEDSKKEIRFVDNLIYDIVNDIFHLDYLLAAVTAVLWFRANLMLRLTEQFGPLLVMIYRMSQLVVVFLFIYFLGLLTFACVATLTLSSNPNFVNLFEAMRTYIMASLGNFDLYQYDVTDDWKRYFGIGMHVAVLFSNMILMINLLIAIMSDQYSLLSEVRTGLFWSQVIQEMPKLKYDKHYGVLNILPFFFGWLSFLIMPFMTCIKDPDTLQMINEVCCQIAYFPILLVLSTIFITVNAVLIPFAYVKTVIHKAMLLSTYKSASQSYNLVIFIILGLPILVFAQFADLVRFMKHSYDGRQRQQIDRHYKLNISLI